MKIIISILVLNIIIISPGCSDNNITNTILPGSNIIIYASNSDVWSMNNDGSNKSNLTSDIIGSKIFEDISLEKRIILFTNILPDTLTGNHQYTTYIMDLDGKNKKSLNNAYLRPFHPRFSLDASLIVFDATESVDDVYIMNIDGTGVMNITNDIDRDWMPVFTKDNNIILYVSEKNDSMDIYILDLKTMVKTNLTKDGRLYGSNYRLSHDGSQVFYSSAKDGQMNLFKINLDGTGQAQITSSAGNSICDISSDDSHLLFYSWYIEGYQIKIMDSNGQNEKILASTKRPRDNDYWRPCALFAPDNKKIIFTTYNEDNNDIFVIDLDGNNPINITQSQGDEGLLNVY